MLYPEGIALAGDGTIYVADSSNARVQRFLLDGTYLGEWGGGAGGDVQLMDPVSVAVAWDGTVYVGDRGLHRVLAFGTSYLPSWHAQYYDNRWLAGAPKAVRRDLEIDFDWANDSPGIGIPIDGFAARWHRHVWFDAGKYRFILTADDGVRLWVDDDLVAEEWRQQVGTLSRSVTLSEGYHRLQLEYFDDSEEAYVSLMWAPTVAEVYLPIMMRNWPTEPAPTPSPTGMAWYCAEPDNDNREGACGPMVANEEYQEHIGSAGDARDWFYFDVTAQHTIEAWLTEIPQGCDYDLYLRDPDGDHITSSANPGNADEHISWGPVAAGRYYLVVVRIEGWNATVPYALRADFEAILP
jgi:hypothetical protein